VRGKELGLLPTLCYPGESASNFLLRQTNLPLYRIQHGQAYASLVLLATFCLTCPFKGGRALP